uniref:Membrane-bound transcription factor site-2 protease n=1 Tax=Diabrotica virgifera virgifera TaxID=50390 RepID=A0A6P7FCM6_DIAVI
MDIITALIVIAVIYGVLLFFDSFFKTCAHYPYLRFLEGTGFKVKFLSITWQTRAFNRTLIRLGTSNPRFWNIWFSLGLHLSLILLPVSVLMLFYSISQNFVASDKQDTRFVIEPVVPGVNLPASELGYYGATLIIASIVHELGHALAAVMEDVSILEVGASIFFVLPVAYVNLATDKLFKIERKKTLQILCAGVWHNVVLSAAAFALYLILPILFSSTFYVNKGISVTEIAKKSPIMGAKGLAVGDVVFKINDCKVTDENSWYECFGEIKKHQMALCIDTDLIHNLDESVPLKHSENGNLDCCDGTKFENICFEYLDSNDGILELPSHACLPARKIVEESPHICTTFPHSCPSNTYCFRPIPGNYTYLIKLTCKNKMVIYLGHPADIYRTVEVSSYIPKFIFTTPTLPDTITKFTKYLTIISLGLAIVNIVPFMYMDGHYILEVLGYMLLRKKLGKIRYKVIVAVITAFFTIILAVHCVMFLYRNVFM